MRDDIAKPGADDPDLPTEAVGSWPAIDLGQLGLPRLGWVFVAVALFVSVVRLRFIGGAPLDLVPDILLSTVRAGAIALLPAALLWRAHDAIRTHSMLLSGLVLVAVAELILAATQVWPVFRTDDGSRSLFDAAWPLLTPAGSVLIGLGLLRLRAGPARLAVLATILATYVGLNLATYSVGSGTGAVDAYSAAIVVIVPAALAVAAWVPVAAWLESEAPQTFWGLLAVALPLGVISRLLTLLGTIVAATAQSNALFVPVVTINALLGGLVALFALAALARLTPLDAAPSRAGPALSEGGPAPVTGAAGRIRE